MRRALPCLLAIILAGSSSVVAEVRVDVRGDRASLTVVPVAGGVWSPRAGTDPTEVLNPTGDLLGHGFPAHRVKESRVVAAWSDQDGSVHISDIAPTSRQFHRVPEAGAVGPPRVLSWRSGFLIAWQAALTSEVRAVSIDQDGLVGEPVVLGTGTLLAVAEHEEAHLFVFQAHGGQHLDIKLLALTDPGPAPIPIPTLLRRVAAWPQATTVGATAPLQACAEWTGEGEALIAWQAGKNVLGRVEVFGSFATDSSFQRGPSGSCRALLNAAGR